MPKKYLIAYIAPNDRILTERRYAETQKDVIKDFYMYNSTCEIIAITLLEE